MQDTSEDLYQIATLVVIVLTALVLIAYLLIFINPRIALNPFKPPLPTTPTVAVAVRQEQPPTGTPTSTNAATATLTPAPTDTATATLTSTPTSTPTFTATPYPTLAPASATATPRPPTRTPTVAVPPTPIPSPYSFRPVLQSCTHSGGTFIKGKVTSGGQPQEGMRVRVATSPDQGAIEEQMARNQGDGNASYSFVLKAIGAFDTPSMWYVWVIDATGNPASDPNFHVATNNLPADDPASCWLAVVDFVK